MSESIQDTILCYVCSANVTQLCEKSIGGYIYKYCSNTCANEDFTSCSNCGEAEVSKKDCSKKRFDCCHRYLGGELQYYCSDRCEGEDTNDFIQSFRKKV